MAAIRENHPYSDSFPFVLRYMEQRKSSKSIRFHYHNWYEIVFIHSGEGQFFIDPGFMDLREGNVFLIPGNQIHSGYAPDSCYFLTAVLFSPSLIHQLALGDEISYLDPFVRSENHGVYRYSLSAEQKAQIEQWLAVMKQEMTNRLPGYRHAVLGVLHLVLIELLRVGEQHYPERRRKESKSDVWMKEILDYIHRHLYDRKLSLKTLSNQALVSPSHFSRVFKRMTGFHLPDYLRAKRILRAKDLLLHTDSLPAQIAELCGFQSLSHYHRTFKAHFGMTPGAFRNHHRGKQQQGETVEDSLPPLQIAVPVVRRDVRADRSSL